RAIEETRLSGIDYFDLTPYRLIIAGWFRDGKPSMNTMSPSNINARNSPGKFIPDFECVCSVYVGLLARNHLTFL
ncbi:MAG: hypothetical protein ACXWT1_19430, partial [Methylobacter sp.]